MWFILIGSFLQEEEIKVSAGKTEERSVKTFFKSHKQKTTPNWKTTWKTFYEAN